MRGNTLPITKKDEKWYFRPKKSSSSSQEKQATSAVASSDVACNNSTACNDNDKGEVDGEEPGEKNSEECVTGESVEIGNLEFESKSEPEGIV